MDITWRCDVLLNSCVFYEHFDTSKSQFESVLVFELLLYIILSIPL